MRLTYMVMVGSMWLVGCGPQSSGDDDGTDGADSGSTSMTGETLPGTAGMSGATTVGTTTVGTTTMGGMTTTATSDDTAGSDTGPQDTGDTGTPSCGDVPCDDTSYCDFIANSCGMVRWDESMCAPRPDDCELGRDVCGCDGQIYAGECEAAANGVDIAGGAGCTPPEDTFACGPYFCGLDTEYCSHQQTDVLPAPDGWTCTPLPEDCGDTPSCDCLQAEPCAEFGCDMIEGGGLAITCPGG